MEINAQGQWKNFVIHFNPQKKPLFWILKVVIFGGPLVHSFLHPIAKNYLFWH
jgi:hypothetical protein